MLAMAGGQMTCQSQHSQGKSKMIAYESSSMRGYATARNRLGRAEIQLDALCGMRTSSLGPAGTCHSIIYGVLGNDEESILVIRVLLRGQLSALSFRQSQRGRSITGFLNPAPLKEKETPVREATEGRQ